ncbi:hypothetical protein E3O19_13975 [Cryobacterium algoritolerans]|uniref:DUF6545 domain-containing protein n=1 Tax=Cryobacterium algoritolerans TaxID=1259184 RepID=A0A4R8WNL9_9MICO|nr:MAB_1171c family putative transporter [Cryobacterium algoritolerans]TFC11882.1 hypothetical protein E3O19_13975 [Cryobacterium algoritolerans]
MLVVLQLGVCSVLWLATLFCLPSAIRGRRRLLFWFLTVFALTMTVQPEPLYDAVDAVLGGVNTTFFLFHATVIIAVALMNSLVQLATTEGGISRANRRSTVIAVTIVIGAQSVLFFGSDWRLTSDVRAMDFDRWDYTLYAITTWFALAYFAVSVLVACLSDYPRQRRVVTRLSLAFISLGCLAALTYAVVSVWSAISSGHDPHSTFTASSRGVYFTALLAAPICVSIGLGLTTVVDGVASGWRNAGNRVLLWRISPLWERLIADSPELSIEAPSPRLRLAFGREPGARLYRRYVEVRDSLLLHPRDATAAEHALLDAVERQTHADRPETHPRRLAPAGPGDAVSVEASPTPHTTRRRGRKP